MDTTSRARPLAGELVDLAREFAREELRPVALAYDESEEFPAPLVRRAAELGLTAYNLPREYGGGGVRGLRDGCAVIEELAWGDSPIAWVIGQGGFFADPILVLGSEEQKRRWIPPLCDPEPPACAVAITEPGAGSDEAGNADGARGSDGGHRLRGHKEVNRN